MDFNYVFFQAILHVGAPYIKKMRHFCDIGLHPLLDYNDLTLMTSLTKNLQPSTKNFF